MRCLNCIKSLFWSLFWSSQRSTNWSDSLNCICIFPTQTTWFTTWGRTCPSFGGSFLFIWTITWCADSSPHVQAPHTGWFFGGSRNRICQNPFIICQLMCIYVIKCYNYIYIYKLYISLSSSTTCKLVPPVWCVSFKPHLSKHTYIYIQTTRSINVYLHTIMSVILVHSLGHQYLTYFGPFPTQRRLHDFNVG